MSVTIREAMTDPHLFGNQFAGESWKAWLVLLCGFYALALNREERRIWESITRRAKTPQEACEELWLVVGRRGGKSQIAALLAVFTACFFDYSDRLAPGEVGTVLVLAADRKQARSAFRYISGLLHSNPMLERMIVREDRESIELSNRTVIEVGTASFRSVRGYTIAAVIADEIAFWRSEDSANPDFEIINALRPAMATLGGKLIALSSPYSRRGELWENYKRHYGQHGPILVAQAETRLMNPLLSERVIKAAYERDPLAASAEYGAQFRNDIAAFIGRDLLDNNTRRFPLVMPPRSGFTYFGFVDVAGGGADEYTLSIAFRDGERVITAGVWAELGDPATITAKYAAILKSYRINRIQGDRYSAEWSRAEFRKHGITQEPSDLTRSEIYQEFLPMLLTGTVELPPDEKALNQFAQLERRTGRSGKDTIDHGPGTNAHDDRANAIAGAAINTKKPVFFVGLTGIYSAQ